MHVAITTRAMMFGWQCWPNTIVCFCVISYGQSMHVAITTRAMMFGWQCWPVSPGLKVFKVDVVYMS